MSDKIALVLVVFFGIWFICGLVLDRMNISSADKACKSACYFYQVMKCERDDVGMKTLIWLNPHTGNATCATGENTFEVKRVSF